MSRAKVAETGKILLDTLHIEDEEQSKKRLQKRQISENTYIKNTPGVSSGGTFENKFQRVNFLGARKPGVVPNLWSAEEDELLRNAVKKHGERNWRVIAEEVPHRNHLQCLQRWKKALRPGLVKGHWSKDEDELLLKLIKTYTQQGSINNVNWTSIAQQIDGRNPKQCRERWFLNLDPSINRGPWTSEEDRKLLELAAQCGGRWSLIAKNMDGRTENSVKTRFHSLQRQEARNRGWTSQEDQALLNATLLFGREWGKIAKQLPGRSRGQLKKRFAALTHHRPDLVRQVQAIEADIAEGKITPPNPPPPPVGTIVAPFLQQANFESVQQAALSNGHPSPQQRPVLPQRQILPIQQPSPPPPQQQQQQTWPQQPINYYQNTPPQQPQQPIQPPPPIPQQQHLPPRSSTPNTNNNMAGLEQPKKGMNRRYGSSWMAGIVDNLESTNQPGMLASYQSDIGGGLTDATSFLKPSDGTEINGNNNNNNNNNKGLNRADTSNLAMLDKLLTEPPAGPPPPGDLGTEVKQKTMKQYSSWGSIGGGDIGAMFGNSNNESSGTGAPPIMRTGSGKGLQKMNSSSLNWGATGGNLATYESSDIKNFLNML